MHTLSTLFRLSGLGSSAAPRRVARPSSRNRDPGDEQLRKMGVGFRVRHHHQAPPWILRGGEKQGREFGLRDGEGAPVKVSE